MQDLGTFVLPACYLVCVCECFAIENNESWGTDLLKKGKKEKKVVTLATAIYCTHVISKMQLFLIETPTWQHVTLCPISPVFQGKTISISLLLNCYFPFLLMCYFLLQFVLVNKKRK